MAKRRKSRRSRRSRSLGCVGCGPGPTLNGLGFGFDEPRPMFKYALYAALAYFAYTKFVRPGAPGLSGLLDLGRNSASQSLNRPSQPGVTVEVPTGYPSW